MLIGSKVLRMSMSLSLKGVDIATVTWQKSWVKVLKENGKGYAPRGIAEA